MPSACGELFGAAASKVVVPQSGMFTAARASVQSPSMRAARYEEQIVQAVVGPERRRGPIAATVTASGGNSRSLARQRLTTKKPRALMLKGSFAIQECV